MEVSQRACSVPPGSNHCVRMRCSQWPLEIPTFPTCPSGWDKSLSCMCGSPSRPGLPAVSKATCVSHCPHSTRPLCPRPSSEEGLALSSKRAWDKVRAGLEEGSWCLRVDSRMSQRRPVTSGPQCPGLQQESAQYPSLIKGSFCSLSCCSLFYRP